MSALLTGAVVFSVVCLAACLPPLLSARHAATARHAVTSAAKREVFLMMAAGSSAGNEVLLLLQSTSTADESTNTADNDKLLRADFNIADGDSIIDSANYTEDEILNSIIVPSKNKKSSSRAFEDSPQPETQRDYSSNSSKDNLTTQTNFQDLVWSKAERSPIRTTFLQMVQGAMDRQQVVHKALESQQLRTLERQLKCDPRATLTVPEMLQYYGYVPEVHHVTTSDGYILELHRVLTKSPKNCASRWNMAGSRGGMKPCQPVLLQHGLLGSSSAWIMNEPSKALAYILADRGLDVWMGNARGNIYSLNHTTLDLKSAEYWDFSFDEMGKYDLPAMIDYILSHTGRKQLHYVGHSMGTTMFWVMSHHYSAYAKSRVASMTALAPVAFLGHTVSPIALLAPFNKEIEWMLIDVLGEYRIMTPNYLLTRLTVGMCSLYKLSKLVCSNMIFLLVGFDNDDLDLDWLPVILGQLNAGTSTKTIVHFAQLILSAKFNAYDYGSKNYIHYNQSSPLTYNLSRVTVPVLFKWGNNDWLADRWDVQVLNKQLNHCPLFPAEVSNSRYNHLDFLWGRDAAELVYKDVYAFIRKNS